VGEMCSLLKNGLSNEQLESDMMVLTI